MTVAKSEVMTTLLLHANPMWTCTILPNPNKHMLLQDEDGNIGITGDKAQLIIMLERMREALEQPVEQVSFQRMIERTEEEVRGS